MVQAAIMAGLRTAVLAVALCPAVAVAQTAAECAAADQLVEGRVVDLGLPEDLGGDWVTQPYETTADAGVQTGVTVTHCASGNALGVVLRAVDAAGNETMAATVDPVAVFRAAIASPEATSIDAIMAEIVAGGAAVQPQAPTGRESCGCALLYPDLGAEQTPWEEWGAQ